MSASWHHQSEISVSTRTRCENPTLAFVRHITPFIGVRHITLERCEQPCDASTDLFHHLRKGWVPFRVAALSPQESSKRVVVLIVKHHDHASENLGMVPSLSDPIVKLFGDRSADIDLRRQKGVRTHKLT